MNQKEEQMTLGLVVEAKDKVDSEIINSVLNMIVGLNLDNIVFRDKKMWENYFGKNLNLTKSLLKANEHYRKYFIEEKKFLKQYRKKCLKDKNTNLSFLTTDSVALNTEIDGFLSQIKSSLDTLATTLNPLLGLSLNGWHKVKSKSGVGVINSLEKNLDNTLKGKASTLKETIKNNMESITYIVGLRDKVHHQGGLKCITEITYEFKYKKVIPQYILHPNNTKELTKDFILRTINEIVLFTNQILFLSILIKAPNGMGIKKNEEDKYPPYNWVIL